MLNMQTFYELLFKASEIKDPYLNTLNELTNANSAQMNALESDLTWQDWSTQATKPLNA
jgi:hypothetical protein